MAIRLKSAISTFAGQTLVASSSATGAQQHSFGARAQTDYRGTHMSTFEIHQFIAGQDNYCVLLHDTVSKATISIDAPDATLIMRELAAKGWSLTHILVTHHHGDHTVGIPDLKSKTGCQVIGPALESHRIQGLDRVVREGDTVVIGESIFSVLETPGHTLGHIAYFNKEAGLAFVGDTLFTLGCGRVLEGDYPMMWKSLKKLAQLPPSTLIYSGHEYTAANARFALQIEPENRSLQNRARMAMTGASMVPSRLSDELETNPFLRADDAGIRRLLGLADVPAWKVFGEIRDRKNRS
jgi:hydroxyacylglutathione hydrolase